MNECFLVVRENVYDFRGFCVSSSAIDDLGWIKLACFRNWGSLVWIFGFSVCQVLVKFYSRRAPLIVLNPFARQVIR